MPGKFSQLMRNQNGMTQAYGDVLEQRFSGGSDEAKEAFAKFVGADSVADAAYSGTPHFDRSTGKVYLDFSKDAINPRGAGTTFFHEHGHYIDFMSAKGAGYTSTKGADFGILLRSDFDNYIKAVMQANKIKTKTDAYAFVSQELRGHITHSVSDLCGGLSKTGAQVATAIGSHIGEIPALLRKRPLPTCLRLNLTQTNML